MLNAATGWDMNVEELVAVGERRINMMRAFNMREGFAREDDDMKKKFFEPLRGKGPTAGIYMTREEFERMKDEYYRQMGWDVVSGNPSPEKLETLGLEWISLG
jgi:aldehyde:ferredoxin oxidoreductase